MERCSRHGRGGASVVWNHLFLQQEARSYTCLWGGAGLTLSHFQQACTLLMQGIRRTAGTRDLARSKSIPLWECSAFLPAKWKTWDGFQRPGFFHPCVYWMGVAVGRAPPFLCAGEGLEQILRKTLFQPWGCSGIRALSSFFFSNDLFVCLFERESAQGEGQKERVTSRFQA